MTLPTGTALSHGTYVIDAFSAEDSIGPMYLATHIPSGRWVQLRILGSRHPELIPYAEVRKSFYGYLLMVQALNHPLFSGHLSGFEDTGVCYQALDANLGHPLSRIVSAQHPIPPRQSVALVRQVAQGLMALKPLGWQGLTLTPDQLWQRPNQTTLTFTGFDLPGSEPGSETSQEAAVIKGLSHLLYFLLTGKRAEQTRAPLAIDVRHQLPGIPYALDTALQVGSHQELSQVSMGLKQWVDLLPDGDTLSDHLAVSLPPSHQDAPAPADSSGQGGGTKTDTLIPPAAVAPPPSVQSAELHPAGLTAPSPQSADSRFRKVAPAALVLTALVASCSGLGIGLMARLKPTGASDSSTVRLNPEQSFPPLPDWNGDDLVEVWEYSPNPRHLPHYGDTAPRPAVVVPDTVTPPASLPDGRNEEAFPTVDDEFSSESEPTLGTPSEEGFFDDPEPFTTEPTTLQDEAASELMPADSISPIQPSQNQRQEPAANPAASGSPKPPPPLAPQPLTAPAPLPSPPPSAPAPSTS